MNLVIDSSFIMSSISPDEEQEKVDKIYNEITKGTYKVFVPSSFYLECNNVLLSSLNKGRLTEIEYNEYIQLISQLPVNVDKFSSTPEGLQIISNLATIYKLTSYDSSYLELVARLHAKIASLDKDLVRACGLAGLETAT